MSETERIVLAAMKLLGWILKPCPSGCFQVIKLEELKNFANLAWNPVYTPWMYALMNKEKKLYAINFNSIEELRRALFDADQIVYGNPSNPSDYEPNPLYQKSDEEILMMIDLGKLPSS